jgi:hypothetical protein
VENTVESMKFLACQPQAERGERMEVREHHQMELGKEVGEKCCLGFGRAF